MTRELKPKKGYVVSSLKHTCAPSQVWEVQKNESQHFQVDSHFGNWESWKCPKILKQGLVTKLGNINIIFDIKKHEKSSISYTW